MKKTLSFALVGLLALLSCLFLTASNSSIVFSKIAHKNDNSKIIVLSGDIGGTNARLRLSQLSNQGRVVLASQTYKVADYRNLIDIIKLFMSQSGYKSSDVKGVCLGVAAAIINNEAQSSSVKWFISAKQLESYFGTDKVLLINDFEAIGYGLEDLETKDSTKDLYVLQKGNPVTHGLRAYIGAGTGLGVGFASWDGSRYVVHPSQGGHVGFAPSNNIQVNILKYMRKKYSHALIGSLLSGTGIVNIYEYFHDISPSNGIDSVQDKNDAARIVEAELKYKNPIAKKTLDTFVDIYGAQARDIAYTLLPSGGLYITGGIAPKILNHFIAQKRFMKAFIGNGYLSELLKDIPVVIVLNTDIGLQGAEKCAFRLVKSLQET